MCQSTPIFSQTHFAYLQTAVICYGAVVVMETMQVALTPYQAFQMQIVRN